MQIIPDEVFLEIYLILKPVVKCLFCAVAFRLGWDLAIYELIPFLRRVDRLRKTL